MTYTIIFTNGIKITHKNCKMSVHEAGLIEFNIQGDVGTSGQIMYYPLHTIVSIMRVL